MTTELTYLAYTIALFFAVVSLQATTGIMNNGLVAMMNNRDGLKPPTVIQARAKRLTDNFRENLWFFVPLVLIAAVAGVSNPWTVLAVQIFFWARLAHAVWYIAGWPLVRPVFWFVSLVACGMIFWALFSTPAMAQRNGQALAACAPLDVAEAVACLDRNLPRRVLPQFGEGPLASDQHMGIGRWIRNNWGLWSGGPLADFFVAHGVRHPDDMSGTILHAYELKLAGCDLDWNDVRTIDRTDDNTCRLYPWAAAN